jgi:hypothetical protein
MTPEVATILADGLTGFAAWIAFGLIFAAYLRD